MPKNLVMISLDGVSQTAFWQYHESMPNTWKLANDSLVFMRFFSASTDSLRSFADVAFGDASELDHNPLPVNNQDCFAGRADNFFTILHERGYLALGIRRRTSDGIGYSGAWPECCGKYELHRERDSFYRSIDTFLLAAKTSGKSFVLHVADEAARPDDESAEKAGHALYHSRFDTGFGLLDQSVGRVLKTLSEHGQLENTIIMAYGPYGMDPWRHGVHHGRTIGIEPYADLCWTPMILHNCQECKGTVGQLFSTIDIKPTLMQILFPGDPPEQPINALAGVNILSEKRQLALTQSMNALAREEHPEYRGVVKSYAVTDGEMRFMVSSHGGILGDEGMELYYDMRDPGNGRNLLDFFTLDQQGNMVEFGRRDIIHVHFTQSFRRGLVENIAKSYTKLRNLARQAILLKEEQAFALTGTNAEGIVFPVAAFAKKKRWV